MADVRDLDSASMGGLASPEKIWFELHRDGDACDVIVRMEDNTVYTALFATLDYISRQMDLSYQMTNQLAETPCVRYAVLDTPHIIVPALDKDTIEDTIDNLIALDVFEGHFTRVTEHEPEAGRTNSDGKLATQEVAAVVISDVLLTQN